MAGLEDVYCVDDMDAILVVIEDDFLEENEKVTTEVNNVVAEIIHVIQGYSCDQCDNVCKTNWGLTRHKCKTWCRAARGGGVIRNGGIRDLAILNGGIRDLRPSAGAGLCCFSWREMGFLATGGDRNLDYFAIFWRDSKYYPFHPSIWLFNLADPKPNKQNSNKHKHSLWTSAFISPFLGIILQGW